jgi:DNA polymerase III delta prime subunit
VQEKLLRASLELASLQREIEIRNEVISRQRSKIEDQKEKLANYDTALEGTTQDRIELLSGYMNNLNILDMSRQYKIMQSELIAKINVLQLECIDTKSRMFF